jgi:cation:H+ antiporter
MRRMKKWEQRKRRSSSVRRRSRHWLPALCSNDPAARPRPNSACPGVLFGATILALATSLPEISTGLQAIKQGDDNLAISEIFGGNAFLPALFLVATAISGKAVLSQANASDIYLTSLAALLTLVYGVGLVFRSSRRIAGMGIDSLVVLILYVVGVGGLVAITTK